MASGTPSLDHLLLGEEPGLTPAEVAVAAGVDRELANRLWRAMGFPTTADDVAAYTRADVEALARAGAMVQAGLADPERLVHVTRTLGQSLSRVAETLIATAVATAADVTAAKAANAHASNAEAADAAVTNDAGSHVDNTVEATGSTAGGSSGSGSGPAGGVPNPGYTDEQQALAFDLAPVIVPELEAILVYLFRRHLLAAAGRMVAGTATAAGPTQVVGFVDIVGFTRLSQQISDDEMVALVAGFEATAADAVVTCGGRVVKTIGDEILFTVPRPADGADIALTLAAAGADSGDPMPQVRAGLAYGPLVERHGDVLGPVVNLAARAVKAARPDSVLVDPGLAEALSDDPRFVLRPTRTRTLKGIGPVPLHVVRRA